MNVFLIGYRGCGKSTVARHVAALIGWPWIDADAELERRAGKSIKQIFADDGEPAFRDLESTIVAELAQRDAHAIALGGGAVLREANRQAIAGRGLVAWLEASPETLAARIAADPTTGERRPSLTGVGGVEEIRTLLARRTPLYRQCADMVVDAETADPDEIARQIVSLLHERNLA